MHYCKFCNQELKDYKKGMKVCSACKEKGLTKLSPEEKRIRLEKRKKTMKERYGVEMPHQSETIRNKRNKTIKEKYGVDNISQSNIIKEKKKQTLFKNYGVDSPLKSKILKDKFIDTNKKKYGFSYHQQSLEGKQKLTKQFNFPYNGDSKYLKYAWCIFCGKQILVLKNSTTHQYICDDCKELNLKHKLNSNILNQRNKKAIKTNQKKYGVDWGVQNNEIKRKIKKTNLERYGVENPFQSNEIKEKIKSTLKEKYGVDNISKSDLINNKIREKYISEKLSIYLSNFQLEILDKYNGCFGIYNFKCLKCNKTFEDIFFRVFQRINHCPFCGEKRRSHAETEIVEYLKSIGIDEKEIILNTNKIIYPNELDIYIPEYNLAIEYHGLYWHSTEFNENINSNKHFQKFKKCYDKDIRLIQIFEDEWNYKRDIVEKKLLHILHKGDSRKRIFARKCEIKEIDAKTKNLFLEKYHIQGKDASQIKLGAFYNNELISVMTFAKGNISKGSKPKDGIWELSRFASHYDYIVIGIAGKLLNFFEKNYQWDEIFSYADLRWSVGNVYYKLGFELDSITQPGYFYTKHGKRIHRFNLRKKGNEPKNIPEYLLRLEQGYYRIWDSGHLKFIKREIT